MDIELTIKNYRCFPDSHPAQFTLRPGLTAFVGKNNAGKSSILRFLYEFRNLFGHLTSAGNYQLALNQGAGFSKAASITDVSEMFHNGNARNLVIAVEVIQRSPNLRWDRCEIEVTRDSTSFRCKLWFSGNPVELPGDIRVEGDGRVIHSGMVKGFLDLLGEAFKTLSQTLYIGPFRNPVNIGSNEAYFDIQVGQAFIQRWHEYKSGPQVGRNEAARKVEKQIQHIFELADLQINATPDQKGLQLFLNDRSFKLSEVGAGFTHFLVVLANVAVSKPTYILIDEPELGLHPSLQLDFLTTLASYAPTGGVLFATHNVGLARAAAAQLIAVEKLSAFESRIRPLEQVPRLSEFLGELSFGGYREFGFDKILLVEGPTDLLTVQQVLRVYGKDHSVLLLHMGGNSLINGTQATKVQLEEVKRISDHVFALIDSEKNLETDPLLSDRADFQEVCREAGIECKVLDRRATENYLNDRVVKKMKGPSFTALGPFEKIKSVQNGWSKSDNWLMAREMTGEEWDQTDLGQFIASL